MYSWVHRLGIGWFFGKSKHFCGFNKVIYRTDEIDDIFTFPEGVLLFGEDNVITIVQVKKLGTSVLVISLLKLACA